MDDTIAAISTPIGEGGIAIVRVSGPHAFAIADAMFVSKKGLPSTFPTHTIHFGKLAGNGHLLDEVMLSLMRAPHTYTTEDVIEINCHGGVFVARSILAECLHRGARLAEPGEFTKRAFLNGRIDLTQAEAVMDLISAKTQRAQIAATIALEGHLARKIEGVRDRLMAILAHIEACIDFPEEDISPKTRDELFQGIDAVSEEIRILLTTAKQGKILRVGIAIAIVGRPNAGKSSLMNALLCEDRSIVTAVPGTTRDTIEESANIRGIPVRFTDTAGIRKSHGEVESAGIIRSHKAIENSDLVIHVVDSSRKFNSLDIKIMNYYTGKPNIVVQNKIDLCKMLTLPEQFSKSVVVPVSCFSGYGIEDLRTTIENVIVGNEFHTNQCQVYINERHANSLHNALQALLCSKSGIAGDALIEIVAQQLRIAANAIGMIVGKTSTEDLLSEIFSTFCIGK